MPDLKNKTILILSPQSWGKMFVSKHHYAVELARRGNAVFFLNPPDQVKVERKEAISITSSGVDDNLFLIEHALFFPYILKFRALPLFHWLMKFQVKKVLKKIGRPIDVVWSFDIGNLYPLTLFGTKPFKIFHPVDEPLNRSAIEASKGANIIFSVTREILEKYKAFKLPGHFINHGVSEEFLFADGEMYQKNEPVRIGFSGNLLRPDVDREVLMEIVEKNKNNIFEFWGSYKLEQANIGGGEDARTKEFIGNLRKNGNVVLHGAVTSGELAISIRRMDAFLICYDVNKDQSRGTNYHKVMEYLGTGRVIISNNITTYHNQPDLISMVGERENNNSLPSLFASVVANLDHHNAPQLQIQRRNFAKANVYSSQIDRIQSIING